MSVPYLGEIKIVGFNFAPKGWAFCNGQILPISQNQSLYFLLGTTYGGDGRTTFALPDLRGRTPLHQGDLNPLGKRGGQETVTLAITEMADHTHIMAATDEASDTNPLDLQSFSLAHSSIPIYSNDRSTNTALTLNPAAVTNTGGSQAHDNMQPSIALNFCIALQGLLPSRN